MLRTPSQRGLFAGLLATIVLTSLLYLLSAVGLLSFTPYDLADIGIRLTPGAIATQGIETLGIFAKLLIKAAAIVGFVLLGGALGALVGRGAERSPASRALLRNAAALALLAFMLVVGVLNAEASGRSPLDAIRSGLLLLLSLGWSVAFDWIRRGLQQPTETPAVESDRRTFLVKSGAAVVTIAVGSTALAELLRSDPNAAQVAQLPPPTSLTPEAAVDLSGFNAPAAVRPRITPQSELYTVASRTRDPRVDPQAYRLQITGNVEQPFELTLDEILQLPRVDQTSTLECISNEVGGNLIGNCRWNGTPLAALLERAQLRPGSTRVALYGADGYVDSITIADALKPTTLIVYGIDNQPLTVGHGYPVRLIVPNIFGMKNVKWLEKIDVVTFDLQGYWQDRGWSQPAIVQTTSVIDTQGSVSLENGVVPLGGIAFAGSRGVQGVEVQIDDGAWATAELEPESSPLQWRRWRYDWPATPGRHTISVRATDGTGELQTDVPQPPHPDGATGYHAVRVNVRG